MEWTRGPIIGKGSTATVSLATSRSGDMFVVKSTSLSCSHFLQREQQILSKLNSPSIVKYLGFNITVENNNPTYNICMEYVNGGSLHDAIQRHGGRLDEAMIRLYSLQILEGMDYLHENGYVHCDIKSQNLLVSEDGVKIADLGSAKMVESDEGSAIFSGTPLFMAPEVARREEQGFKADIWAVGCTVIEMATGRSPWQGYNDPLSALYRIGYSDDVPEFPSWLSEKGKDFLSKCLVRNPKERWTAKELLKHPFVNELEFNVEKIDGVFMRSPNAVLCQGFWDELEVLGCDHEDAICEGSSSHSPAERINKLAGEFNSSVWSSEKDWITVRNNCIDETEKPMDYASAMNSFNEISISTIEVADSNTFEEDIGALISDDNRLFEFPVIDVSTVSHLNYERNLMSAHDSVQDELVPSSHEAVTSLEEPDSRNTTNKRL